MKTILTIEDLFNIQNVLEREGYGELPLKIQVEILTKERMKTINEMLRQNDTQHTDNENEEYDQINVNVGNIEFQYVLKNDYNQ
jgi:hypothetical protein